MYPIVFEDERSHILSFQALPIDHIVLSMGTLFIISSKRKDVVESVAQKFLEPSTNN